MAEIPLHNRAGDVVAVALVDDADYELVKDYHWHFSDGRKRYVAAQILHPEGGVRISPEGWIRKRRTALRMHRLILGLAFRDPREPDHINGNPLDNRRVNLRLGDDQVTSQNTSSRRGSSSRYRGVNLYRGRRWQARARLHGHQYFLGYFDSEEEAGAVAAAWRRKNMPFATERMSESNVCEIVFRDGHWWFRCPRCGHGAGYVKEAQCRKMASLHEGMDHRR